MSRDRIPNPLGNLAVALVILVLCTTAFALLWLSEPEATQTRYFKDGSFVRPNGTVGCLAGHPCDDQGKEVRA